MLVLTRRMGESICVGGGITITVLAAQNGRARIGIEAPPEVSVNRQEIQDRIDQETGCETTRKFAHA